MELIAIPIAFAAGLLSLLSPCVLPMLPTVAASAVRTDRRGIYALAAGLALAFALAGTLLTFLLLSLGISTEVLRTFSAFLMLAIGLVLLIDKLGEYLSFWLSRIASKAPNYNPEGSGLGTQFAVGGSLGLVWLPCVGPTLGTAIALASTGQSLGSAFAVMLSFGVGTALPLIGIGLLAQRSLPETARNSKTAKRVMGVALLGLSLTIFTGFDRVLEMWAIEYMPDWVSSL